MKANLTKVFLAVLLLSAVFYAGRKTAAGVQQWQSTYSIVPQADNWGLGFAENGSEKQPSGNASPEELKQHDAYFVGSSQEKIIYLTFDCGYENGNTKSILKALKKHKAKATFFVVGHFLETNPDLAKQMVEEGHTVGNHTYHHPDMSSIATIESFRKELEDNAALFQQATGKEMAKFYRPPQGKYSVVNLKMAKELGYHTFFWSLAYVDWYEDKQPSHQEAFEKLTGRIHPGAIVLLHSTSKTNGEILDELLGKWEKMGYTFQPLSHLIENRTDNASDKSQTNDTSNINSPTSAGASISGFSPNLHVCNFFAINR